MRAEKGGHVPPFSLGVDAFAVNALQRKSLREGIAE
jgi:hypothetical protein